MDLHDLATLPTINECTFTFMEGHKKYISHLFSCHSIFDLTPVLDAKKIKKIPPPYLLLRFLCLRKKKNYQKVFATPYFFQVKNPFLVSV